MTNITDIRQGNTQAAADLIASFPGADAKFNRKQMIKELPDILETALGMILDDLDASPGRTTSGAIGCRIIAACICRLKD
jgi:hypothetical protein